MVTLTQLRTFLAVAETESVRAAAERLVVTESAVSSCVAALQKELGLALVAKNGRGLRLTEAGEVYAGYARSVLGLLDEARAAAAGEAAGAPPDLVGWLARQTWRDLTQSRRRGGSSRTPPRPRPSA